MSADNEQMDGIVLASDAANRAAGVGKFFIGLAIFVGAFFLVILIIGAAKDFAGWLFARVNVGWMLLAGIAMAIVGYVIAGGVGVLVGVAWIAVTLLLVLAS
jgi:hypothetical protein